MTRSIPRLLIGVLLLTLAPAARAEEKLPHEKYVLENGLTVILHEDHRVPLVVVDVWYQVGARDEPPGRSGFAHLFEHLMFMGTTRVPGNRFDEILEAEGGWSNASTDYDMTDYYEVGPSHLLPTMLWLEADRMEDLGHAMTQKKLDLQREVVRNEIRESYDNAPYGVADLRVYREMFPPSHPYHHHVIGSQADLSAATVEDVQTFFATYYVPNSATLVVAGDFDPKAAKELIEWYFGGLPRADALPLRPAVPLTLDEERRVTLPDDVSAPRVCYAWHSPAFYEAGDAELDLVAQVLAEGRNGRLFQRLVNEQGVAMDVAAWQESMRLSSLFRLRVTAVPGVPPERLEAAVDAELEKLRQEGPGADELARVVASWEASTLSGLQSLQTVADTLQYYDFHLGEPDRLSWDLDRYRKATVTAVRDAARRYLTPDRRLVLRVVPRGKKDRGDFPKKPPAHLEKRSFTPPTPAVFRLPNGLTVWHLDRPELPLVEAHVLLDGGACHDQPNASGLAALAGLMLREGAGSLDAAAYGRAMQALGATVWVDTGREHTVVGVEVLRRHADEGFRLLGSALTQPRLEDAGWADVKDRHRYRLMRRAEDAENLAARVAQEAFFAPRHAGYASPPYGRPQAIHALPAEAGRRFHAERHRPENSVLLLAGDLRLDEAKALVEAHLGSWKKGAEDAPPPRGASPAADTKPRVLLVHRPRAEQTAIHAVWNAARWDDERRLPLRVLAEILGGSFTSRLNARLREQEGYTYGAYAWLELLSEAGTLQAATSVQTDETGTALRDLLEETRKLATEGATASELARAVTTLRSNMVQALEDLSGTLSAFTPYALRGGSPGGLAADEAALEAVDLETVNALAHEILSRVPVLVLVGDRDAVMAQLKGTGLPMPTILTVDAALAPLR